MKLTLTRKVFLGYFLMICLVVVEGAYAIFELNRLNQLSRSMVRGEVASLELEKKLIDLFLSEVSHEKKYLVVQDPDFLELALSKSREFEETLLRLTAGAAGGAALSELEAVRDLHDRHVQSFTAALEEAKPGAGKKLQDPSGWTTSSESGVRAVTRKIESLIRTEEMEMARKMGQAQLISWRAYKITIGILISMGAFGLITAWLLTRSIRVPIQKLTRGTRDIAQGVFENRIEVSSRDEFADLAGAFNAMTGKLAELEKVKREIISNISHELRTPLTSMKEATELLYDQVPGPVNDTQKRLLGIIREGIGKLVRMINNLLDLSKIRAGMMQYHFEKGDVAHVISVARANVRFLAELRWLVLEVDIEPGLPPLYMDSDKIEQVLNNLLSNAIKFTPEGGRIRIRASRSSFVPKTGASPVEVVRVCVEDNGTGIDSEQLTGIFDRYQQADPALGIGTQIKGTGLGLSICKYYVEEHGGRIWAESEDGAGSRFYFDLPLKAKREVVPA